MTDGDNIDDLIRRVEGMAKPLPPGVGDGRITGMKAVKVPAGGGHNVVVLDRIEPGWTPPYCTHGRATCVWCEEWVWLGHATQKVVVDEEALPICRQCAAKVVPPGMEPVERIEDHRRTDGPHE